MTRSPENAITHLAELLEAYPELLEPLITIVREYMRASRKHPDWPSDPVHASAILNEEAGELTQAVLQLVYEGTGEKGEASMVEEAVQTGSMALRFLVNVPRYQDAYGTISSESIDGIKAMMIKAAGQVNNPSVDLNRNRVNYGMVYALHHVLHHVCRVTIDDFCEYNDGDFIRLKAW